MRDTGNAIEVTGVNKSFKVYYDRGITLKDKILSRGRSSYELREVLKGISFEVKKGEAIGLIGRNGCGKSTTLKLLTKIIYPDSGNVELQGRVSSLLELGAGFHPDMSGRENIYMNAAVFGLNRKEIDKRINDIIKFSELEEFIDNPVRTYSSGMYMRLAFSVAINVDADILLIDEILAVGDISFQIKCFEKLKEIKINGTTIVIVSHSMDQIEKICDRSIWIESGLIKEEGRPREIHEHYLHAMEQKRLERFQDEYYGTVGPQRKMELHRGSDTDALTNYEEEFQQNAERIQLEFSQEIIEEISRLKYNLLSMDDKKLVRGENQKVYFTEMYITNANREEKLFFETGTDIYVYLRYAVAVNSARGTLCLLIYRDDGVYCYGSNTFLEKMEIMQLDKGEYLRIKLLSVPLLPGKYMITIAIHDEQAVNYDFVENIASFQMFSNKGDQGVVRIKSEWSVG